MPSFSDLKNMYKLQKEAKRIKKELKSIHVEAEAPGIKVVVSAEPEILRVELDPNVPVNTVALVDALNRALKKGQLVSAERMQGMMGEMGITPGAQS